MTGHCSTASNQSGVNRMTVFRRHTKSQPCIKQLRKLHLSSLFDRLALGYWHENFADWYETKGKSIFFSHAGFESRAMRFSGPKSPRISLGVGSVRNRTLHTCLSSHSQESHSIVSGKRKTLQIARICRYEAHKRQKTPGKANLRLFRDFSGIF